MVNHDDLGFIETPDHSDLDFKPEEDDVSQLESGLRGAGQGISFGFSDEMIGAARATKQGLTGETDISNLLKKYRELQKEEESKNKLAQETNPWTYGAGEIGGSLAPAMFTGGGSLAAGGARLAGKEALKQAAKNSAYKAVEGATYGTAYGAGTSEVGLEQPLELVKDMGTGALLGGVLGGVMEAGKPMLAKGSEWVKGKLGQSRLAEHIGAAYKAGSDKKLTTELGLTDDGIKFGSKAHEEKMYKLSDNLSEKLFNRIQDTDDKLGKRLGETLEVASKNGQQISITDDIVDSALKLMKDADLNPTVKDDLMSEKVYQTILYSKQSQNPLEVKSLINSLDKMYNRLEKDPGEVASRTKGTILNFRRNLMNHLETEIPDFQIANNQFKEFRSMMPERIVAGDMPLYLETKTLRDLGSKGDEAVAKGLKNLIEGASVEGGFKRKQQASFGNFLDKLNELDQNYYRALEKGETPINVFETLGKPREIEKEIRDRSSMLNAWERSQQQSSGARIPTQGIIKDIVLGGQNLAISGANWLGNRRVPQIVQKTLKGVYNLGHDQMSSVAKHLQSKGGQIATLGVALEKSLVDNGAYKKNAALFSILQRPDAREALEEILIPQTED